MEGLNLTRLANAVTDLNGEWPEQHRGQSIVLLKVANLPEDRYRFCARSQRQMFLDCDYVCNEKEFDEYIELKKNGFSDFFKVLPPVEHVVLGRHGTLYIECKVLYHDKETERAVCYSLSPEFPGLLFWSSSFKPKLTEHEKAVQLLAAELGDLCPLPEVVERIIELGWRKPNAAE